jgi:hypothetical protein
MRALLLLLVLLLAPVARAQLPPDFGTGTTSIALPSPLPDDQVVIVFRAFEYIRAQQAATDPVAKEQPQLWYARLLTSCATLNPPIVMALTALREAEAIQFTHLDEQAAASKAAIIANRAAIDAALPNLP